MSISRQELIDSLANMTVLELSQLIKDLEEKFGVSAAAPMAMAAVAAPAAAAAPKAAPGALPGRAAWRGRPLPRR